MKLTDLETHLNTLLQIETIADYAPNGIQVQGGETVRTVVTGVSACLDLFQAALAIQADLILVHHGLFWEKQPRVVTGNLKQRLRLLLAHDLTLMAYHLPLDCHPELGNNIHILKRLALNPVQPFGKYHGHFLSFIGQTETPVAFAGFSARVQHLFGGNPLVLPFGPEKIQRVAVCSGAAPELIREAKEQGADLFLSGEATEPIFHYAKEERIHFIAAGHHRTETFGVRALGDYLAGHFKLEHHFIDIPNPL